MGFISVSLVVAFRGGKILASVAYFGCLLVLGEFRVPLSEVLVCEVEMILESVFINPHNKCEPIKALNEGTVPPNSARILVVDQKNRFPLVSFLRKDEEATIKLKW
ncbi:MAG: hypothetical protein QM530_04890 [Phycisphaerales bacterium]|nr:hypothetical protein [Phycisphaerales bacterium]